MSLYSQEIEIIVERVGHLIARRELKGRTLSQADIAKAIGVSPATVSNFLNRKDVGDVKKMAAALKAYVEREEARDEGTLLKLPFVPTRQAREVNRAIEFCHKFGRMAALIGGSGWGKSRAIQEAVTQDPALILVKAWAIGVNAVLRKLCESLRVHETGTRDALMKRIQYKLTGSCRCIIVDESHTLSFGTLDMLRHVYDETGVGMLFIGIDKLKRHLTGTSQEYEQLASRVSGRIYELPPIQETDLMQILRAVLRPSDVEPTMKLLRQDPLLLTSVRRMANFLEIAGILAKGCTQMTYEHVQKALKYAA